MDATIFKYNAENQPDYSASILNDYIYSYSKKSNTTQIMLSRQDMTNKQNFDILLNKSKSPEEYISYGYELIASSTGVERFWKLGLKKFSSSSVYFCAIGVYYYCNKMYDKSLNYLKKSLDLEINAQAIQLSIIVAIELLQFHLVLDYFNKLDESTQKKLSTDMLQQIARAANEQSNYKMAIKVYSILLQKKKAPPLPELEEIISSKFNSSATMKKWFAEKIKLLQNEDNNMEKQVGDSITCASILMLNKKYDEAQELLHKAKKRYVASHPELFLS